MEQGTEQDDHMSNSEELFNTAVPTFSFYMMCSQIKMFEYMAMGKPVIANEEIPEHEEVLEESGGGILVSFTPKAFSDTIVELLDDRKKDLQMGRIGL